jgi:hypothetical protein
MTPQGVSHGNVTGATHVSDTGISRAGISPAGVPGALTDVTITGEPVKALTVTGCMCFSQGKTRQNKKLELTPCVPPWDCYIIET